MKRKTKVLIGLGAGVASLVAVGAYAFVNGRKPDPDPVALVPKSSRTAGNTAQATPEPKQPKSGDSSGPWVKSAQSGIEDFGGHLANSGGYALKGEFGSALAEVGKGYKDVLRGILGG